MSFRVEDEAVNSYTTIAVSTGRRWRLCIDAEGAEIVTKAEIPIAISTSVVTR